MPERFSEQEWTLLRIALNNAIEVIEAIVPQHGAYDFMQSTDLIDGETRINLLDLKNSLVKAALVAYAAKEHYDKSKAGKESV